MRLAGDHRHLAHRLARTDVADQLKLAVLRLAEGGQRAGKDEIDRVGGLADVEQLPAAWQAEIAGVLLRSFQRLRRRIAQEGNRLQRRQDGRSVLLRPVFYAQRHWVNPANL
jgi:hypothetical protein